MKRKLFYGIPLALAIFIGGCSAETDQENEPPVEDTENDVEDEDFKLDDDKSDSDGK
jgi:PBP1b-binding outer membrane lipoprotein LpoB